MYQEAERLMMGDSLTSYNTTSDTSRLTPSISESSEPTPPGWPIYKAALFRYVLFSRTFLLIFFDNLYQSPYWNGGVRWKNRL